MKSITKMFLAVLTLGVISLPVYADNVTETTTTVTTIRTDAPIYMGPVQEIELRELTLVDFQHIATKPATAMELFNNYKEELNRPRPNSTLVPYKMKITDRVLGLADFQGGGVSQELATARYHDYLREDSPEGKNVHYVYIYHTPIARLA